MYHRGSVGEAHLEIIEPPLLPVDSCLTYDTNPPRAWQAPKPPAPHFYLRLAHDFSAHIRRYRGRRCRDLRVLPHALLRALLQVPRHQ